MLVVVQYNDESYDMVIDYHLRDLISAGKIVGFSSSNGWVKVGYTPRKVDVNEEIKLSSRIE